MQQIKRQIVGLIHIIPAFLNRPLQLLHAEVCEGSGGSSQESEQHRQHRLGFHKLLIAVALVRAMIRVVPEKETLAESYAHVR